MRHSDDPSVSRARLREPVTALVLSAQLSDTNYNDYGVRLGP